MAEKLIVQIDLDKGDVSRATASLEKSAAKSGKKSAKLFSKEFDSGITLAGFSKSIAKATSLIAGLSTAYLGFKSIDAAQTQEDAINNLNNALRTSNSFTQEASNEMQRFASELQDVTRFGDEAILSQIALAKSFGATNEQATKIVSAAADLSAAFGMDIQAATMSVAKTLGGLSGELGNAIPQLKELGVEGLKAGKGIDFIANRFSGAALRDVNTYSGAIDQLKNSFGDTLEAIGRIIIKNPQFISLIKQSSVALKGFTESIDNFAKGFNLFEVITKSIIPFNEAVITYIIAPLELLSNIGNIVSLQLQTYFAQILSGIGNLGFGIAKFLETINIGEELSKKLRVFEESSQEVAEEVEGNLVQALKNINNFSFADSLSQKNEDLRAYFDEQNAMALENQFTVSEIAAQNDALGQSSLLTWQQVFSSMHESMSQTATATRAQIEQTNSAMIKFASESTKALRDGFARGAGQAFAAFGQAIAKGENALDAFTKALFKTIADQAVALGTSYILQGSAMLFSPNPADNARAPFLIKSGAALAAFGGFMGATAGGGAGALAGGGGNTTGIGIGNVDLTNEIASPDSEQERVAPSTNVSIQVQGSLVQQEELGEFITRTLNETFGKQGVTLTDARFA